MKSKLLSFIFVFLTCGSTLVSASPLYYTFEGIVNDSMSFNDSVTIGDFGVVPGKTSVKYVFEIDFNRSTSQYSNTAGTWDYFYTDLISGALVNGEHAETNRGFDVVFDSFNSQGHVSGGSRLDIITTSDITDNWRVEDWHEGQIFNFLDGGYFSEGQGAFYLIGNVQLVSIADSIAVPEPSVLFLFAFGLIAMVVYRKFGQDTQGQAIS